MLRMSLVLILTVFSSNAQEYALESVSDCAACHEDIYSQWESSMHYKSTLDKDILYRGMYDWAMEDTKGKISSKCKNCHTPYSNLYTDSLVKGIDLERSVDCVFCHSIEDIHKPPIFSRTKYSSSENAASDYHRIESRLHFSNEKLCMLCHSELRNPQDIPICITGDEFYNQNKNTAKQTCQNCHMPLKEGYKSDESDSLSQIRSHQFLGPHNPEFLNKSLKINGEFEGDILKIKIDNSTLPHAYPTGSPLRLVLLKVMGYNSENKIIYQNWKANPVKEDPKSVFGRFFSDDAGNFPVPPWKASYIKMESRLKPGEIRELKFNVPESTKSVNATLFFQLAPTPILNRLKIDDPYLRTSHLIDEFQLVKGE